jgi:hypothetical protein
MDQITQRETRASESILENESLTAGLDDETAQALLDWGLDCAKLVARSTAGLDDEAAEEAMYPRLRATRHLMRQVRRWSTKLDAAKTATPPRLSIFQRLMRPKAHQEYKAADELWSGVVAQAAIVYGQDYTLPGSDQRQAFLKQYAEARTRPLQVIASLRKLVEPPAHA